MADKYPHVTEFVTTYMPVAQRAAAQLGVDPSLLLAQWGLETGWGKSILPGTHNLGNITDPSGRGVTALDAGNRRNFKIYKDYEDFADSYARLIQGKRYASAVGTGSDIHAYASALKAGGYAEDPNYVKNMIAAHRMVARTGVVPGVEPAPMPAATPAPAAPTYFPNASAGGGRVPTLSPAPKPEARLMNPVYSALGITGDQSYNTRQQPRASNNPFNIPTMEAPIPNQFRWDTEHLRQLIRNAKRY